MIKNKIRYSQNYDTHPMQRLTFTHHKGGTGKTTSCLNIAGWLTKMHQKVLVIDLDPQANATTGLGVDLKSIKKSICDVLLGFANIDEIILKTDSDVYLAPAVTDLLIAEAELARLPHAFELLNSKLEGINDFFDFILIDSPPGSGILMLNCIVAARNIVIPMDVGVFSYETLEVLDTLVLSLEHELNISINIVMTLLKKFSPSFLHFSITRNFYKMTKYFLNKNKCNSNIYAIPFSKKICYAQMQGLPISHYAPSSSAGKAYRKIAKNIMQWNVV